MIRVAAVDDLATANVKLAIKMTLKDSDLVGLQDRDYQNLDRETLLSASNHYINKRGVHTGNTGREGLTG